MEEYKLPTYRFSDEYEFLDFVKKHRNIFNDKTTYRTSVYFSEKGVFFVVKEFNYFRNEKSVWLWITDNKRYWVIKDVKNPNEEIDKIVYEK